jgi:Na+/H+ antiporter NhaC
MKRYWTYVLIVFALVVFFLIDFGAAYSDDKQKPAPKTDSQVNRQAQQTLAVGLKVDVDALPGNLYPA